MVRSTFTFNAEKSRAFFQQIALPADESQKYSDKHRSQQRSFFILFRAQSTSHTLLLENYLLMIFIVIIYL